VTASGRVRIAYLSARTGDGDVIKLSRLRPDGWVTGTVGRWGTIGMPPEGGPRLAVLGSRSYIAYTGRVRNDRDREFTRLVEVVGGRVVGWQHLARQGRYADIAVDARGRVHAAYVVPCKGLWYARRSLAGHWTRLQVAPRATSEHRPSITLVGGGRVAITAERGKPGIWCTAGTDEILFRTNRSGSWTGGSLTDRDSGPLPRDHRPTIAAGADGKARVVFLREMARETVWMMRER
jgi:hypothetical protein